MRHLICYLPVTWYPQESTKTLCVTMMNVDDVITELAKADDIVSHIPYETLVDAVNERLHTHIKVSTVPCPNPLGAYFRGTVILCIRTGNEINFYEVYEG